jgi:hypothetical protein
VRVGVVHGTAQTRALLEKIEAGDPDAQYVPHGFEITVRR